MALTKAKGNMYPWVTHTHTCMGGECPHKCVYCYVDGFRGRAEKYQGPLRLIENELKVHYGSGKTIFIEHCNDLFAGAVPNEFIIRILLHCQEYPQNTYVFQTKNPARYREFIPYFPRESIFGTTIETNRTQTTEPSICHISNAPTPWARYMELKTLLAVLLRCEFIHSRTFVTIEPVLDFDVDELARWIVELCPTFFNLGADSKHHNLPEPSQAKIGELVSALKEAGIEVRLKENLKRLFPW